MSKKKKRGHSPPQKPKTELGHKLFAVRRDMPTEVRNAWYEWFKSQQPDMGKQTFEYLSRGDYIAKDNVRLAIAGLKEGKRLMDEYTASISQEVSDFVV